MNREEILKECLKRFDSGYFKVKNCSLMSCDNNLEFTGKLLMAMTREEKKTHTYLIDRIKSGLNQNIISEYGEAFIPRTIWFGCEDPNSWERKKNLWENIRTFFWCRTDVSYSQFSYLLQGCMDNINEITVKMLSYMLKNNFKVRRSDGKTADNGSFNTPYPNVQLRKYFIKECSGQKHNLLEKFYYILMQYIKPRGSNGLNTILIYYSISKTKEMSKRMKKIIINYIDDYLDSFVVTEFQDNITWLLLDKIKKEINF